MKTYDLVYKRSLDNVADFWAEAAENIHWFKRWDRVLDDSNPPHYRWFPSGKMNTCHNALDRHVDNGHGERLAVIYDSPVTATKRTLSYKELQQQVALFAGVLSSKGITKGDRVIIYMPMVPETLVAILACTRIGAVHSVVFGGFAAQELATRIEDAGPKAIVSASCGIEPNRIVEYKPLLDSAIAVSYTHLTLPTILRV